MRMNLPPDRQGHLSDLTSKTLGELKELLERQEKLLSRRTFINTLPDKGEKCRMFAEYLATLISQRSQTTNNKASLMSGVRSCSLNQESIIPMEVKTEVRDISAFPVGVMTRTKQSKDPMDGTSEGKQSRDPMDGMSEGKQSKDPMDVLSEGKAAMVPIDVMTSVKERQVTNMDLAESLQKLSIGKQENPETTEIYQNAYERVVKKVEAKPQKERFMPNRIPKSISDMATMQPKPRPPCPVVKTAQQSKLKHSVPEESNVRPPQYKYRESKMISIGESMKLIDDQRARNEKLLAENAAQRLAAQVVPKMATYSGGLDMRYRAPKLPEQGDSDDDDDDDEEKEIDYGDEVD